MITRYVAGRELRLVRNPYFHEWSAAAQPSGYPDRITIPLGLSPAHADTAIAAVMSTSIRISGGYRAGMRGTCWSTAASRFTSPGARDGLYVPQHQRPAVQPGRCASSAEPCLRPQRCRRRLGGRLAAQPTCQLLRPRFRDTADIAPTPVIPATTDAGREPISPRRSGSSPLRAPGVCASSSGTTTRRPRVPSRRAGLR